MPTPLNRFPAERVALVLRGGSSSPVVVETPAGRFVVKLRGSGHGVLALASEIIVAELAERLGLPVPERALIDLPAAVPSADQNDELADLLARSVGLNLGFRWLEGARALRAEELAKLDDELVARVLWLDGLTMNLDRTQANPNLLFWKGQSWLIDHGAALPFHHDWASVTEESPREPADYEGHVFMERRGIVSRFDVALAERCGRAVLTSVLASVPDEFLAGNVARSRAAYEAFLWKRLRAPRPFAQA